MSYPSLQFSRQLLFFLLGGLFQERQHRVLCPILGQKSRGIGSVANLTWLAYLGLSSSEAPFTRRLCWILESDVFLTLPACALTLRPPFDGPLRSDFDLACHSLRRSGTTIDVLSFFLLSLPWGRVYIIGKRQISAVAFCSLKWARNFPN